ncbi:MAG: glycosyltransferase [Bacteroidota bacterium]
MKSGRKILILTYYWPPCGGAGVQRWLKFAKYLPEYGWEPIVLTVDPEYAEYPAFDESLEKDIRPELRVYKTKALNYFRLGRPGLPPLKTAGSTDAGSTVTGPAVTKSTVTGSAVTGSTVKVKNNLKNRIARFIRGNFFIPDPRKGWNRYAVSRASELISKEDIKYIITTSPPHSTQLIGLKLKSLFPDIKWIADLRDPWTDIYYYKQFYGSLPARIYDRRLEKKVLHKADKIITVGESLASLFAEKQKDPDKNISVITNGYDEEDFVNITAKPASGKMTITYTGSVTDQYPVKEFLDVINDIFISNTIDKLSVRIVGRVPEKIESMINSYPVSRAISIIPYTDHRQSIKYMMESNILLLLIPDYHLNKLIITGKVFEYLRAGKPILAIGPHEGDAAKIIREAQAGETFEKNGIESIKSFILDKKYKSEMNKGIERYSHKALVQQLTKSIK